MHRRPAPGIRTRHRRTTGPNGPTMARKDPFDPPNGPVVTFERSHCGPGFGPMLDSPAAPGPTGDTGLERAKLAEKGSKGVETGPKWLDKVRPVDPPQGSGTPSEKVISTSFGPVLTPERTPTGPRARTTTQGRTGPDWPQKASKRTTQKKGVRKVPVRPSRRVGDHL